MVKSRNSGVPVKATTQSATFSVKQLPYKSCLIKFIEVCFSRAAVVGAAGIQSCNKLLAVLFSDRQRVSEEEQMCQQDGCAPGEGGNPFRVFQEPGPPA